jgi:hypothetical protein
VPQVGQNRSSGEKASAHVGHSSASDPSRMRALIVA